MKDVKKELQPEYYGLLDGNIQWNGNTVGVHYGVPDDAEYPLIALGEYTQVDDSDKSSFGDELTFTLRVVDRFPNSSISRAALFSISNDIKEIIRTVPNPFDLASFNVITATVDNQTTFKELTDTYLYVHEQIRFRHEIEQVA